MNFPEWLTPALRIRKVLMGKDFYLQRDIRMPTRTLGNVNASWTFLPGLINERSVIYSFGVGRDLSFDIQLANQYNATVHAFDPTPETVSWVNEQVLPEKLHFYPVGIAAHNGDTHFFAPNKEKKGSYSLLTDVYETEPVIVPVKTLYTLMHQLGHTEIDLLKLDIEGAEYDVIGDILENNIAIKQLLVEFHHRFKGVGIKRSLDAITRLRAYGYKLFHVSFNGEEVSFIYEKEND